MTELFPKTAVVSAVESKPLPFLQHFTSVRVEHGTTKDARDTREGVNLKWGTGERGAHETERGTAPTLTWPFHHPLPSFSTNAPMYRDPTPSTS